MGSNYVGLWFRKDSDFRVYTVEADHKVLKMN